LATQHKQNQFFKDHGEFVEPIAIRDESNDTDAIGYIIPFEEKLKHLLSNPETESIAFKTTDLSILRSKNIKSNISDGTFIQDSICEQAEGKTVLNLNLLYYLLCTTTMSRLLMPLEAQKKNISLVNLMNKHPKTINYFN
jgi:hypothetical protein